ncbi:DnaJ sub A member 2 [Globodera pallida]|nr:DnaJ sub A member 2 [Globodera pallida]
MTFPGGRGGGGHEELFEMLNGGGGMGGMPFSLGGGAGGGLFQQMFGGGGRQRARKGETTVQPMPVTLEDLYKGKTSKLQLTKKTLCKACNGIGGKQGSVRHCERCHGSGKMLITRQIGPGMIQQMAGRCDKCAGEGEVVDEKDRCKKCVGRKTVQEQKIIEVKITPGMRENQKIVFYGEGDQEPGIEPGDVVLVIKTKPHEQFERKGDDLFMKKTISLADALCGFTTAIKHLDGRQLVLTTMPGEIIKPESIRSAMQEGMPKPNSADRGNLYVIFDVKFPKKHFLDSEDKYNKLLSLLPPRPDPPMEMTNGEVEEVTLAEFDTHRYDRGSGGAGAREAYHDDSSDEEGATGSGGAQHVQCQQQ